MDFREGRLSSRLVHWRKSRFLKKRKVECNAHEQRPNSGPVESHSYSMSLRYIFTYKIFSRGFQVVAFVEICQPKSCKSVLICHVPDVASLRSSSFIYLRFRCRVQIMDFILSFAPFSCMPFQVRIFSSSLCKVAANLCSSLQRSNFTSIQTKATCVIIKYNVVSC